MYTMKMIHFESLASIPDDELFADVERLTARSNVALVRGRSGWTGAEFATG